MDLTPSQFATMSTFLKSRIEGSMVLTIATDAISIRSLGLTLLCFRVRSPNVYDHMPPYIDDFEAPIRTPAEPIDQDQVLPQDPKLLLNFLVKNLRSAPDMMWPPTAEYVKKQLHDYRGKLEKK